jgi:hypothetical protein
MSSIVHIQGVPYLIMSEEYVGNNMRKIRLSKYRGEADDPRLTNTPGGLILVDADDIDDPKEITVKADENRLPGPISDTPGSASGYFSMNAPHTVPRAMKTDYVPPEGEATMKVYCLQSKEGRRFWYVNASKTKQYREDQSMDDAQFITFEVPKTKAGLIHFLNEVCG